MRPLVGIFVRKNGRKYDCPVVFSFLVIHRSVTSFYFVKLFVVISQVFKLESVISRKSVRQSAAPVAPM